MRSDRRVLIIQIGRFTVDTEVTKRFKDFVLTPLNATLMLCCDELTDDVVEYCKNFSTDVIVTTSSLSDLDTDGLPLLLNKETNAFGGYKGSQHRGNNARYLHKKRFLRNYLMSNHLVEKFDIFIVTRPDFFYVNRYPDLSIETNQMLVPVGADWDGLNDRHFACGQDLIVKILSQLDYVTDQAVEDIKHVDSLNMNPEILLLEYVHFIGANYSRFVHPAFLVTSESNRQFWSPKLFSPKYGRYLNCTFEYDIAHAFNLSSDRTRLVASMFERLSAWRSSSTFIRKRVINNSFAGVVYDYLHLLGLRVPSRIKQAVESYRNCVWNPYWF